MTAYYISSLMGCVQIKKKINQRNQIFTTEYIEKTEKTLFTILYLHNVHLFMFNSFNCHAVLATSPGLGFGNIHTFCEPWWLSLWGLLYGHQRYVQDDDLQVPGRSCAERLATDYLSSQFPQLKLCVSCFFLLGQTEFLV